MVLDLLFSIFREIQQQWGYWIQVEDIWHRWTWLSYVSHCALHQLFMISLLYSYYFLMLRVAVKYTIQVPTWEGRLYAIFSNSYLKQNWMFFFLCLGLVAPWTLSGELFISHGSHHNMQRPGFAVHADYDLLHLVCQLFFYQYQLWVIFSCSSSTHRRVTLSRLVPLNWGGVVLFCGPTGFLKVEWRTFP